MVNQNPTWLSNCEYFSAFKLGPGIIHRIIWFDGQPRNSTFSFRLIGWTVANGTSYNREQN